MFIGSVVIEHIEGKKNSFKVVRGFLYENDKYQIIVYRGWITDGASVPRLFWNTMPPFAGRYVEASVLHDALYMAEALPRKECDDIFLEAMKEMKVSFWKRWTMYLAVRAFGWYVWKKHTKESVEEARKYVEVKEK